MVEFDNAELLRSCRIVGPRDLTRMTAPSGYAAAVVPERLWTLARSTAVRAICKFTPCCIGRISCEAQIKRLGKSLPSARMMG